jgi:hypothetical protein
MNTLLRTHRYLILLVIILGCAVVFISAQTTPQGDKTKNVQIYGKIVMHPAVTLRKEDADKLCEVLATADKSFYKVAKFGPDGVEMLGELKLTEVLEQEVEKAKRQKLQGFCVDFVPPGGGVAQAIGLRLTADQTTFFEKVAPILKKYLEK